MARSSMMAAGIFLIIALTAVRTQDDASKNTGRNPWLRLPDGDKAKSLVRRDTARVDTARIDSARVDTTKIDTAKPPHPPRLLRLEIAP